MGYVRLLGTVALAAWFCSGFFPAIDGRAGLADAAARPRVTLAGVTVSPASVAGGSACVGTVTLSGAAIRGGATVSLSSSNSAVASLSSTQLVIPAGQTSGSFTIHTLAVNSTAGVTIKATLWNSVQATLSILPPQVSSIALSPAAVIGGQPSTGTLTLSSAAGAGGATVALASNSPYATIPATATVPAGATSVTFTLGTSAVSGPVSASISASFAGSSRSNNLTINPPAVASLAFSPASVIGGQTATGTVTLNGSAPAGGFPVTLMSNSSTVPVPATITVPAGAASQSFSVTTAAVSGSLLVMVVASTGAISASGTLTVNPSSLVPSLSLAASSVTGGTSVTGTVGLSSAAPAGGVSVSLNSSDATVSVPASLLIAAGGLTQTFTASTIGVATTKNVTVTTSLGAATASSTLTVNPATITSITFNPATVPGGLSSLGTIALNGPAPPTGLSVGLASSMTSAVTVPATVSFPGGGSTVTFTANALPVANSTAVSISATLPSGNNKAGTLTVAPPGVAGISFSPATVSFGQSITGTIALSGAAPAGGFSVSLASNDPAAVPVPASVLVAAGASSQTFTVTAGGVSSVTAVTITASAGTTSVMTVLTVNPALSANPASIVFSSGTLVGVPSTQTITLTNSTGAALAISGITASGDFSETNTCPASLGAGASCVVTLTPSQGGTLTGNVTVTCAAAGENLVINLSGTAQHWVALNWSAVPTPGVTYNVYRQTQSGGACGVPSSATYTRVNGTSLSTTAFNDANPGLTAADTYCYAVSAVDSGGESGLSSAVAALIPSP